MRALIRIALIIVGVAVFFFLIVTLFSIRGGPPSHDFPQWSTLAAKTAKTFVCTAYVNPEKFQVKGKVQHFDETWIELKVLTSNSLFGPSRKNVGGYFLCFTAKRTENEIPFFLKVGKGKEIVYCLTSSDPNEMMFFTTLTDLQFQAKHAEFVVLPDYNDTEGEKIELSW